MRPIGSLLGVSYLDMDTSDPLEGLELVATSVTAHAESGADSYVLTVSHGPDRGISIVIDGSHASRVLVGQSPACQVRLTDPAVSRRHFAIELAERGLHLTDLGSTNGTLVDRVRVLEAELSGGEVIRVGSSVLQVEPRAGRGAPPPPAAEGFGRLVGSSPEMRRLYPVCERLAGSEVPIIIEGETGTGKEVLAESLHLRSRRAGGPFVVFDCTAVPPSLVESELFGHERGAFTGAVSTRKGIFEQAHGGTLLIDEIGDLEIPLQPKLLRVLERREVRRIGSDRSIGVDVRVLSATRRDLDREIQAGRFRDDLFHRLAVTRVEIPPLRMRQGDVGVLARHFWRMLGGEERAFPMEAIERWEAYSWPGNVRELRNAVLRRLELGDLAEPGEEPPVVAPSSGVPSSPVPDFIEQVLTLPFIHARARLMEEFEHRYVTRLLQEHSGNVAQAAAKSGIGLRYFQKLRARRAK